MHTEKIRERADGTLSVQLNLDVGTKKLPALKPYRANATAGDRMRPVINAVAMKSDQAKKGNQTTMEAPDRVQAAGRVRQRTDGNPGVRVGSVHRFAEEPI